MEGEWDYHRSRILNDSRNGYSRIFFFMFSVPGTEEKITCRVKQ